LIRLYDFLPSGNGYKVRLLLHQLGIPYELVECDLKNKSKELLERNPYGKVPVLVDGDAVIYESAIINEYLEDKFPTPALLPKSPEGRARVRIITRFHDLYLEPPLRSLFGQMNPKTRDEKVVGEKVTEFKSRLDQLEKIIADGGFATGSDFTLADCALAPTMFFATNLLPAFGAQPLDGRPRIAAWWTHVQTRPSVKKALGEMGEALAAMQRGGN